VAKTGYDRMKDGIGNKTAKGARVSVTIYAYPDGHRNVNVSGGTENPVANDIEALDALVALWAGLRRTAGK